MHITLIGCKICLLGVLIALAGCTTQGILEACTRLSPESPDARAEASTTGYLSCLAELGNREAQLRLGFHYEAGEGVAQDFVAAVELYRRSARDELTRTYFSMVHDDEAVNIFAWRSEMEDSISGLPDAKFALGRMYYLGRGVEKNNRKARKWFERAAVTGHPAAEAWLQVMENNGS